MGSTRGVCSRGGRDGFGSQYFGHMAVFAACRRVPGGLGKGCCYVHNPIKALEHGVGVGSAERFTGMKTDEECSGFKSANGRSMPKNMIIPQFPRPTPSLSAPPSRPSTHAQP